MSKTFLSFQKKLGLTVGLLVAGVCFSSGAALAQGVDPLDTNSARESDPFSTRDNSYSPFFNMMHRIQLGNIRSVSEFNQDQQQSIGSEATDFRDRQRRLIEQNQQTPVNTLEPSAAPAPANQ